MHYSYTLHYVVKKEATPGSLAHEDYEVKRYLEAKRLQPWCESVLREFPYVNWDRLICTKTAEGPHLITCYGWIDREQDSYKDFVVLTLVLDTKTAMHSISSSAKYSDAITDRCAELAGYSQALHKQCIRVEDLFEIPNMVKINSGKKKE